MSNETRKKVKYAITHEVTFVPDEGPHGPIFTEKGDPTHKAYPMYLETIDGHLVLAITLPKGTILYQPMVQLKGFVLAK